MTGKERTLRAIDFEPTDRIPVVGGFVRHPPFMAAAAGVSPNVVKTKVNGVRKSLKAQTMGAAKAMVAALAVATVAPNLSARAQSQADAPSPAYSTSFPMSQPVRDLGFMKGFAWGFPGLRGDFENPEAVESLKLARATGANWVCICFSALMETESTPEILWGDKCPTLVTDGEIRKAVDAAHKLGFKVLLKPIVDPRNGEWRGIIKFEKPEQWEEFFANYKTFMLHYAAIAAETNCELFTLGGEMVTAEKFGDQWRDLAAKVRNAYPGVITYNANHNSLNAVKWWDAVDVISVSAYYGAGKGADSTVEEMMASWKPVRDNMAAIAAQYQKPVFFIEIGMMSTRGNSKTPAKYTTDGQPYDGGEQARYYEAALRMFWDQPWFLGYFWWKWDAVLSRPETSSMNTERATVVGQQGFRINGKPAETVVREWYAKVRPIPESKESKHANGTTVIPDGVIQRHH